MANETAPETKPVSAPETKPASPPETKGKPGDNGPPAPDFEAAAKITKGRWYARIKIAKKTRSLGQFSTFDEAKKARVSAEKLHGFTVRL